MKERLTASASLRAQRPGTRSTRRLQKVSERLSKYGQYVGWNFCAVHQRWSERGSSYITRGLFSYPTSKCSRACGCPPRSMPDFLETAPGALSPAKGSLRAPIPRFKPRFMPRWISSRRHWGQLVARGAQTRWPPSSAADPNEAGFQSCGVAPSVREHGIRSYRIGDWIEGSARPAGGRGRV